MYDQPKNDHALCIHTVSRGAYDKVVGEESASNRICQRRFRGKLMINWTRRRMNSGRNTSIALKKVDKDVCDRLKAEQDLCVEGLYEHLRGVVPPCSNRLLPQHYATISTLAAQTRSRPQSSKGARRVSYEGNHSAHTGRIKAV